ncbi:MAG: hypothetical protein HQK83_12855 [Fibrobacteria bacterium]|nr:hypothetical protein [Fibrobacteria bacterium]
MKILLLFILCFSSIAFSEDNGEAVIEKLSGRVELQGHNQLNWSMAGKGMPCGQNTKIRVHPGAFIELLYANGDKLLLNSNSRCLLNSVIASPNEVPAKIITLYYGSLYFQPGKSIGNQKRVPCRFYGPEVSLMSRNGAVILEAEKKNSFVRIYVLSGMVEIRHLTTGQSAFVKENRVIKADTVLFEPETIAKKDLFYVHDWLDTVMIEDALYKGMLFRKRQDDIITGNEPGKIVLLPFLCSSKNKEFPWNIRDFLTRFSAALFTDISFREVTIQSDSSDFEGMTQTLFKNGRTVSGEIRKFNFGKKAVLAKDSSKYVLALEFEYEIFIQVKSRPGDGLLKEHVFEGKWTQPLKSTDYLEKLLAQPLHWDNPVIRQSIIGQGLLFLEREFKKVFRTTM